VRNVQGYRSFTLHVLYNPLRPESVAAKAQMIHSVEAIFEACKSSPPAAESLGRASLLSIVFV